MSNSASPSIDENIKVFIRQRSYTKSEALDDSCTSTVTLTADGHCSHSSSAVDQGTSAHVGKINDFKFNGCFLPTSDQEEVYNSTARPIIESALKGYSGTIFAYGPTNSGKTYTMRGSTQDEGIMERCVSHLLREGVGGDSAAESGTGSKSKIKGELFVSYLQIYCEMVTDLLNSDSAGDAGLPQTAGDNELSIREKDGKVYVEGLKRAPVHSLADFHAVLTHGDTNRVVAETNMNATSSRSHTVLMMTVVLPDFEEEQVGSDTGIRGGDKGIKSYKEATVFLVDLAGSERATASLGKQYQRQEEGRAINLSLSALGNCMNALAERRKHIPYRDSKLTRLLQGSLGGGARTSVIVTIPPGDRDSDKMLLPVLRFAARATKIRVSAKIARCVDYEALYNEAVQLLDRKESEKHASIISSTQRDELLSQVEIQAEEIAMLKEEAAYMKRQLAALSTPTTDSSSSSSSSSSLPSFSGGGTGTGTGEDASSPQDPIAIERYWRDQMQAQADKSLEDTKNNRSKFEAKIRTLNRDLDKASTEIMQLQNDLGEERTSHLATVGQAKQYQQRLIAAEGDLGARIAELLEERVQIMDALETQADRVSELEGLNGRMGELLKNKVASSCMEGAEEMIPKSRFDELETLFSDTVTRLTTRVLSLEESKQSAQQGQQQGQGQGQGQGGGREIKYNIPSMGGGLGINSNNNASRIQPGGRVISQQRAHSGGSDGVGGRAHSGGRGSNMGKGGSRW